MNLTQLGPGAFALGLAALAGGLFLLQRLRVRHREEVVMTTMFWREALQEHRARTLVERFRHPLSYLLALAIAGLLWLGVARPDQAQLDGTDHVVLLDGSAAMMAEGRFDLAKEAVLREAQSLPKDRTEVLFCGADVRTVLAPGEDSELLAARLDLLAPEMAQESMTRAIRSRTAKRRGAGEVLGTRFSIVGDARPASFGSTDTLQFDIVELPEPEGQNGGISFLGLSPAASGAWDKADATVSMLPSGTSTLGGITATIDGVPVGDVQVLEIGPEVSYRLTDLPLEGGVLSVQVASGGPIAADDVATIQLPDRPLIRVALGMDAGAARDVTRSVLESDPAVELVEDLASADLVVGDAFVGDAAIRFSPAETQAEAILVGHEEGQDSGAALAAAVGELGLDRVDASALADALGRTISVGATPSPGRFVSLWSELLAEDAGFIQSRAFPVLLGRAVRWVHQAPSIQPYAAYGYGRPARLDAAPQPFALVTPGAGAGGLFTPGNAVDRLAGSEAPGPEGPGPWRPYTWFLLAALAFLSVEWVLYQRGRVA